MIEKKIINVSRYWHASGCDLCSSLLKRKLHWNITHKTSNLQIKCRCFKTSAFRDIFIPNKLENYKFLLLFWTLFNFASSHYMYVIFSILVKCRDSYFGKTTFLAKRSNMPRPIPCQKTYLIGLSILKNCIVKRTYLTQESTLWTICCPYLSFCANGCPDKRAWKRMHLHRKMHKSKCWNRKIRNVVNNSLYILSVYPILAF